MNGLDPGMMQRVQQLIQQNPQLAMLLQKPGLMQKLQAIAQNPNDPMIAAQYASDPDVQQLINILGPAMGMNQGGMGGMGGFGGFNNQMGGGGMGQQFGNMGNNMGGMGGFNQQQVMNQVVTHINHDNQFFDIMKIKDKLIVVDFFATWCGPCKMIAPEFERLAKLYKDRAIFVKVDYDKLKSLAQSKGVSAFPTFQFYKNQRKVDEMRGANVRKLEDLITKHITPIGGNGQQQNVNLKPSPYKNFPLNENNRPVYAKAPFQKMSDKLNQLNRKFKEEEKNKDMVDNKDNKEVINYSLNEKEWQSLTQIMNMLQDRPKYNEQKFNSEHYKLLNKLLIWPIDKLPPVLDLIRVLSLHPAFAEYCSKNFDFIKKILKIGGNGQVHAVNGMLTCRIIINLFNRRVTAKILEKNYTIIINNLLFNMNVEEKKNTRLAFVRVLLHYTYCFYVLSYNKSSSSSDIYRGEKLRCLSLLTEILYKESDNDIILNILMAIGTLLFRDENVIEFAQTLNIKMIFKSYKQKYQINKDIVNCCDELIQAIEKPQL